MDRQLVLFHTTTLFPWEHGGKGKTDASRGSDTVCSVAYERDSREGGPWIHRKPQKDPCVRIRLPFAGHRRILNV
jgi:hypothetical protein